MEVVFSEYFQYRARLRGFELSKIRKIVVYSSERYWDTVTGRMIAVGKHGQHIVMIPYEQEGEILKPITIHATTRRQINFRIHTGRFIYE